MSDVHTDIFTRTPLSQVMHTVPREASLHGLHIADSDVKTNVCLFWIPEGLERLYL